MTAETVAGIRIPDSPLAREASDLVAEVSPGYLEAHCRRSHVFAALLGAALGMGYDEELLYLCTVLHDLGPAPNQVARARGSSGSVRSPAQATCPSGRINTAGGAAISPRTGSSHSPA